MIPPKNKYVEFNSKSNMKENKRAWGFPLTKDIIYNGTYVDKPTSLIIKGYYPYYSDEELNIEFSDEIVNQPEFYGPKITKEHEQQVLARFHEKTTHTLVIEVNGKEHVITTDCLALMQTKKSKNKNNIENNEVNWEY